MSNQLRILAAVVFFMLAGCRSAFQPPPEDFEMWQKSKPVHIQQVMAALLECGYPWPSTKNFRTYEYWGGNDEASIIMVERCMEKQGYSSHYGSRYSCRQGLAEQFRQYKTIEQLKAIEHACDPNTPPPEPSIEKRLSSPYCKTEWARKYPQCQPVVVPSAKR